MKQFLSRCILVLLITLLVIVLPLLGLKALPVEAVITTLPKSPEALPYQIGEEIVSMRDQHTKVYYDGVDKYSADYSLGSVHYEDEYGDWQSIDTTIINSARESWDWEVTQGHWHLLIAEDTSVAIGKDGSWIAFKYAGYGYLDWSTKEYVVLGTRNSVTPEVTGNSITWNGIFGGVNLMYECTPDGFKENLYITQTARDWLSAHPPSSYGLNNPTTYLVGGLECDWQSAFPAEDVFGVPINWDNVNEFIDNGVFWRNNVTQKLATALPIGYAIHQDVASENWTKLHYRFYEDSGTHYLLFGANVLELNNYPLGTINLDPSLDEQVGASADDAHEIWSTGVVDISNSLVRQGVSSASSGCYWGGHRWTSESFPNQGDTIDVAYFELYVWTPNDMRLYWHFEDSAAPPTFSTDVDNISTRSRTSASTFWAATDMLPGWQASPSMVTPLQELIDNYSPTAIVVIGRPFIFGSLIWCESRSYDYGSTSSAKLHIEWTAGCSPSISLNTYSWNVNSGNPVSTSSNYATGLTYFTITNNSGGAVTITIGGTDMAGGGYTWDLADDGSPGDMIYGLYAGLDGGDYTIVVKESAPYNTLKAGLADSGTQDFGLKIYTPTNFDDGNNKSGTITLTTACD